MNFTKVDELIERESDELISDIAALVHFNSTEGNGGTDAAAGKPFGATVRETLDAAIEIADRLGFETRNGDGYYGIADFKGTGANADTLVAVLGHLDVVPADPADWTSDPFTLRIDGDKLFGRGVIDDKGPLLAAMYAARALREAGFAPDKTLRFIMGTNEENRMEGVEEYKRREKLPAYGFTPDADWPVVMGEKGIYQFVVKKKWDQTIGDNTLAKLEGIEAGSATNIVPAKAVARFEGDAALFGAADGIAVETDGTKLTITASGLSTHGSVPQDGDNALSKLIKYLAGIDFAPAGAKSYIDKMARLTRDDKYGSAMGLDGRDDFSETTVCPTIIHMNKCGAELSFDMRFRLCDKCDRYEKLLAELAAREELEIAKLGSADPIFADKDGMLIQSLLGAYREVTGDMTEPLVIGGGTYAKHMPGLVAFGPEPLGEPMRAHIADEFIKRSELISAAKIYARAIFSLTK